MGYVRDTNCITPAMAALTQDGYTLTASAWYTTGTSVLKSFDTIYTTKWQNSAGGVTTAWAQVDLPTARKVTYYNLYCPDGSINALSKCPSAWTLQGWDGSQWVVLDTQTGVGGWAVNEKKTFSVASPANYSKYKLDITASCGGSYIHLGEIELCDDSPAAPVGMTYVI